MSKPQIKSVVEKPKRVLACISCQQRKLKCNRVFPCAKCVQAGTQCVPATQKKRRRIPTDLRELSERLKHCESLLQQNNIEFQALSPAGPATEFSSRSEDGEDACSSYSENPAALSATQPLNLIETISKVMGTLSKTDLKGEDVGGAGMQHKGKLRPFKKPWTSACQTEGLLLLGAGDTGVSLASSHPVQAHIFRLWQIYLDAVEPILKIAHVPTLQVRILDAVSDMANIDAKTEALMFSIYCAALMTMAERDCETLFGSPKMELLASYHTACRQALTNSMALRADNLDSLTALLLYLVSVKPQAHPRSLASILATLIRIAKRMGIDNESRNARFGALEAETRRRLWWSLIIFDHRMCELSDHGTTTLIPTWDCRTLQNLNDFELRSEMKSMPLSPGNHSPSEAIYAAVRSELANFVRHSDFHLDFVNPSLKGSIRTPQRLLRLSDMSAFEEYIENKYLRYCNPEHPLHYMTIWTTRAYLARTRLLAYYAKYSMQSQLQTDFEQEDALCISLGMLDCDTQMRTSPLTAPFRWRIDWYVPGLAYNHILHSLWKKPTQPLAGRAWTAMSTNWKARLDHDPLPDEQNSVFAFSRLVLKTWEIHETLPREQHLAIKPPEIISDMKERLGHVQQPDAVDVADVNGISSEEAFAVFASMDPNEYVSDFGYIDLFGQPMGGFDMAQF